MSPPFQAESESNSKQPSNTIVSSGGEPSPADLRKYLMYWDEIDYPYSNLTPILPNPDMQFLIDEGIALRSCFNFRDIKPPHGYDYVEFSPEIEHELMCIAHWAAFDKHDKENPGLWSLAQLSTKLVFLPKNEPTVAVEFELYNMLPVPTADVPLIDILDFKQKHYDELVELRSHLDDVYQQIISSADIPRAKNTELTRLESSLKKIHAALSQSGIKNTVTSLRGYIAGDILPATGIAIGTANALARVQFESPLSSGIAFAAFLCAFKHIVIPKARADSHPLAYISSIEDERTWWNR